MNRLLATLAVTTLTTPVLAQITAQDMVNDMIRISEIQSQTLIFEREEMQGRTLVLYGYQLTLPPTPEQDTATSGMPSFSIYSDEIHIREIGDGSVELTFPTIFVIQSNQDSATLSAPTILGSADLSGTVIQVSGTPDNLRFVMNDGFGVGNMEIFSNGAGGPDMVFEMAFRGFDVDFTKEFTDGKYQYIGRYDIASTVLDWSIDDPSIGFSFEFSLNSFDSSVTFDLFTSQYSEFGQPDYANSTGTFQMEAGQTDFGLIFSANKNKFSAEGSQSSSEMLMEIFSDKISMEMAWFETVIDMFFPDIALQDIGGSLAEAHFDITIPFEVSNNAIDFGLLTKIGDLVLSDSIWALFDPDQLIPRAPVNLTVDLSGQSIVKVNILEVTNLEYLDEFPFLPQSLNLNKFRLEIAGLYTTGFGALNFDYSETDTASDRLIPVGQGQFQFSGIHTLLGKLSEIGLLDAGGALVANAMLGIYARPSGEVDTYTSDVIFAEDGSVTINGAEVN